MEPTLYATFETLSAARVAIGRLVQSGVPAGDITLACKECQLPADALDQAPEERRDDLRREVREEDQQFGAMPGVFPDLRASGPGSSTGDASMASPGIRFGSIAADANAASNPGAMSDFLWGSLPTDDADYYRRHYDAGSAIVIVRTPSEQSESLLRGAGAMKVQRRGYLA